MGVDHVRRAMNAGRRWAEEQLKLGREITPDAAEQAALERFQHRGSQYVFLASALDVLCRVDEQARKSA
jgi:hypothetical protein